MIRVGLIILGVILAICVAYYIYFSIQSAKNQDYLVIYGNVDVRQVDLGFRVMGRVEKMFFEEGDFVPAGKLMGAIERQPYEDRVLEAMAQVETYKTTLNYAEEVLNRRNELVGGGGVSKEDFQNALSSRNVNQSNLKQAEASLGVAVKNLRDTEVYAPNDGIILTRIREPGAVVREADPIYTLSLTNPIWIRAFVSEPDLGHVYPNMEAEIHTDTAGGKVYRGRVGFISPVAEFTPKTVETTQLRTDLVYRLRIYTENSDGGLKQGMPVTVKLPLRRKSDEEKK